jgi:multidrug efflux pump subunit AcrB
MRRYLSFLWANRFTAVLLPILVFIGGFLVYHALPKSIFPDVAFPKVAVLVHTDNLPVRFMLLQVTRPLEQVAKGEPGVRLVRSQTGNGLTKLHVYFARGVNPEIAYLMLQARLAAVPLPTGAIISERLMMPNIYPLAEYALVSNRYDSSAMMPTFAFEVRPALLGLPGVYEVNDTGRGWPEVDVDLSARRLAQYHLRASTVTSILKGDQGPFFSGVLNIFHEQFLLATTPRPATPANLAALNLPLGNVTSSAASVPADELSGPEPLVQANGATAAQRAPLALGEIAKIHIRPPPLVREAAVAGWRHALIVDVSADRGVNEVGVARATAAKIAELRAHLPAGIHLIPIYNLSHLIESSLHDVWLALFLGSWIAWLVVLIFLGRWDAALATLTVVPLSVAGTLLVLHAFGFGINIMTLGGITAAIGALVDHAIVVMERGLHGPREGHASERRQHAMMRVGEILPLMTMATVTSCVIFIPLIFLSGTIGLLFRDMALAVILALITSQIVALVLTPLLTVWISQRHRRPHRLWGEQALRRGYGKLLLGGMRKPWVAIPVILVLAGGALLAIVNLPTAFLPHWDEGIFVVPFRTPVGNGVRETTRVGRDLMAAAMHNPNVARTSLVIGRGFGNRYATPNKGGLMIVLKNHHAQSTRRVMTELRHVFRATAPDLTTLETMQVMINRLGNLSGSHAPLQIQLFGPDSRTLRADGRRLFSALHRSHDFESLVFKSPSAGPELRITPKTLAALYGLTPLILAHSLKTDFWGRRAGFLTRGEQILPIRVRVIPFSPTGPGNLGEVPLRLPGGTYTTLSRVAHVRLQGIVPYVTHQNLVPYSLIKLDPKPGEGLSVAAAQAQRIIAAMHFPAGISPVIGGYYRQQKKSFQQMVLILSGALFLLLILLGFQFSSFRAAISALLATALSGTGAFLALWMVGINLDSTAFLGVLLVFAIGVNNVILIFARAHQLGGASPAVIHVAWAARQRLRPILMTMLADVLGFLPLAIGIGHGTDLLKPLAVAVMGGLTLSAVMSLWLAPVMYALLRGPSPSPPAADPALSFAGSP